MSSRTEVRNWQNVGLDDSNNGNLKKKKHKRRQYVKANNLIKTCFRGAIQIKTFKHIFIFTETVLDFFF